MCLKLKHIKTPNTEYTHDKYHRYQGTYKSFYKVNGLKKLDHIDYNKDSLEFGIRIIIEN